MSKYLDDFLQAEVCPVLRANAFGRDGMLFSRDRHWCVDMIEFLECRYRPLTFTINLGIFVPEMHELVWGDQPIGGSAFCQLRRRIGEINRSGGKSLDLWWKLDLNSMPNVATEIKTLIDDVMLPYLEKVGSLPQLKHEIEKSPKSVLSQQATKLGLAAIAATVGDTESARKLLSSMVNSSWSKNANVLADRLKLKPL